MAKFDNIQSVMNIWALRTCIDDLNRFGRVVSALHGAHPITAACMDAHIRFGPPLGPAGPLYLETNSTVLRSTWILIWLLTCSRTSLSLLFSRPP